MRLGLGLNISRTYSNNRIMPLIGDKYLHPAANFSRNLVKSLEPQVGSFLEVGANLPAFDYRGLSIHSNRSNAFINSNTFPTGWIPVTSGTGATPTAIPNDSNFAAPDGTFTATLLTLRPNSGTTAADHSGWSRSVNSGANTVWVRSVSGNVVAQIGDDLLTGHTEITTIWRPYTRISNSFRIWGLCATGFTKGVFQILVWEQQSEESQSFATPSIRNTGSILTRPIDSLSFPLNTFTTSFTVFGRLFRNIDNFLGVILQVDNNVESLNCIGSTVLSNNTLVAYQRVSGSGSNTLSAGNLPIGVNVGFCARFRIATGIVSLSVSGGPQQTPAAGPISGMTTLRIGTQTDNNNVSNCYFPYMGAILSDVSDSEMQSLSN